ncbi:MAG: hypothetical protein AAF074_12850 [Pseudomonadota bacterium]
MRILSSPALDAKQTTKHSFVKKRLIDSGVHPAIPNARLSSESALAMSSKSRSPPRCIFFDFFNRLRQPPDASAFSGVV